MTIGQKIKFAREQRGNHRVADVATALGVLPATVYAYMADKAEPGVRGLKVIARWLGVPVGWFYDEVGFPEKPLTSLSDAQEWYEKQQAGFQAQVEKLLLDLERCNLALDRYSKAFEAGNAAPGQGNPKSIGLRQHRQRDIRRAR